MNNTRLFITTFLLAASLPAGASDVVYSGCHQFDGTHRNEVSGYVVGGNNVVSGIFVGEAVTYKHFFGSRWSVAASEQIQFGKQLYSVYGQGSYRLPVKMSNLYFEGRVHYNRWNRWNFNETMINLSVMWQTPYVDLCLGESYIHYQHKNDGYSEPLTLTFGIGANIRHRNSPWNIGIFFRNYDQFFYENWNINWGVRFHAPVAERLKLFGELNIRPAGSMSQLATKYESSIKLGLKYDW